MRFAVLVVPVQKFQTQTAPAGALSEKLTWQASVLQVLEASRPESTVIASVEKSSGVKTGAGGISGSGVTGSFQVFQPLCVIVNGVIREISPLVSVFVTMTVTGQVPSGTST